MCVCVCVCVYVCVCVWGGGGWVGVCVCVGVGGFVRDIVLKLHVWIPHGKIRRRIFLVFP